MTHNETLPDIEKMSEEITEAESFELQLYDMEARALRAETLLCEVKRQQARQAITEKYQTGKGDHIDVVSRKITRANTTKEPSSLSGKESQNDTTENR